MTNRPERRPRALLSLSWSSGKDSAWTLQVLREREQVAVVGLLTTITAEHERVSMHAVRRSELEAQARAVGVPLSFAWDGPMFARPVHVEVGKTVACDGLVFADLLSQHATASV